MSKSTWRRYLITPAAALSSIGGIWALFSKESLIPVLSRFLSSSPNIALETIRIVLALLFVISGFVAFNSVIGRRNIPLQCEVDSASANLIEGLDIPQFQIDFRVHLVNHEIHENRARKIRLQIREHLVLGSRCLLELSTPMIFIRHDDHLYSENESVAVKGRTESHLINIYTYHQWTEKPTGSKRYFARLIVGALDQPEQHLDCEIIRRSV
jgi:hypothetical protein